MLYYDVKLSGESGQPYKIRKCIVVYLFAPFSCISLQEKLKEKNLYRYFMIIFTMNKYMNNSDCRIHGSINARHQCPVQNT